MLANLPDLWDVNVSDWPNDSATTRFLPEEGHQNDYIDFVKQVTSKPVVGVGRLTSPDMMVSMIRKGIVDFIGAARPSIADPVSAPQDRRRPDRRYLRVHRLQYLRVVRLDRHPHPLHPEPDNG